jgi:O-antigen/teichoic acid export membrane protein
MTWRGFWETVRRQGLGLVRNPDIQMIRDLIYLGLGQVGVKLVGFVIYAYLARILSTTDYGALESILAVVGLLSIMVDFGMGAAGVRSLPCG